MVRRFLPYATHSLWCLLPVLLLIGCEPLRQSYDFIEPVPTSLPVEVPEDQVWIASVPAGADVYVQSYEAERVPSHATDPDAYRGQTPLSFAVPPGSYWIELAFDASVFESYFTPPFDDAQFEQDGARSEALLFRPFAPGDRRRVLRYYQVEKRPDESQTLIAVFHPRGEPAERVAALYPQEEQYQFPPDELRNLLRQAGVPETAHEAFLSLLQRGGKVVWSAQDEHKVALEVRQQEVHGHIITVYTGTPLPDPLIPDGGGF